MSASTHNQQVHKGRVALITGGSQGIGRAIALQLAQLGATVVINYSAGDEKAQETLADLKKFNVPAHAIKADIGKVSEIRRLFAEAISKYGRLDFFLNVAAIATFNPVVAWTEEEYDRAFNINAKGAFFALQEAAKVIKEGGRIIAFSTAGTVATSSLPLASVYLGTKGAVQQFVKVLAMELADKKVTVNAVSPGYTETRMLPEMLREKAASTNPFKRIGTAEEIANVTTFLLSDEARWVTGSNVQVSGGTAMV